MPKSPVPDKVRRAYIDNYLKSRQEGKIIDDLYWDGKYYFADNKGEDWGGWRLRGRASHSAQGSKRRAMQRGAVASESLYIEAFGERVGKERYLEDKAELKRIWGTRGKAGFDIDHIYPLAAGGQETPRNLMLREASRNRSKGATPPTPEQRQALLLSSDPLEQIKLQGPQPTPKQRANILGLTNELQELDQQINQRKPTARFGTTNLRKVATGLAAGGATALYGGLGTAASAAEVGVRGQIAEQTNNPVDRLQQGIAGASLTADVASYVPFLAVPASIASGALDVTNLGIDTARKLLDELNRFKPVQRRFGGSYTPMKDR